MKKRLFIVCLTAAITVFSGCSTVDAPNNNTEEQTSLSEVSDSESENSVTESVIEETFTEFVSSPNEIDEKTEDTPVAADVQPENPPAVQTTEAVQQPVSEDEKKPEQNQPIQENTTTSSAKAETSATVQQETSEYKVTEPTYIGGVLVVNKTYPLPADYNPGVDSEALAAFETMQKDAAAEGLNLYISSGFRSYEYQKGLYQRYAQRDGAEKADTYSARAGHSEHQTGLAFDLNTISASFADTNEGKWLAENCYKYGFIIRYPADKTEITGYQYEPWHIRYLGINMASAIYSSGMCLEEYLCITSSYDDFEAMMAQQN